MTDSVTYGDVLLVLDRVGLTLGGRTILRDLSGEVLDIKRPGYVQGQVVAVLGPSGVGKTQLFRIIAGLTPPTAGRVGVWANGALRPPERGRVGVVQQNYPLFEHRTVYGNLMVAARRTGSWAEANSRTKVLLSRLGLYEWRHAYPAELSGGQRQRVAIAQQTLCRESILLMDEPFSGLDMVMEQEVCALITEQANAEDLNTVLVVTHDITAAVAIADHLWLLGREPGVTGGGARIMATYDLIERGLCWHPELTQTPIFSETVREVRARFLTL